MTDSEKPAWQVSNPEVAKRLAEAMGQLEAPVEPAIDPAPWSVANPDLAKQLQSQISQSQSSREAAAAQSKIRAEENRARAESLSQEAVDWMYGPVYRSLPKMLKAASAYTEDSVMRAKVAGRVHRDSMLNGYELRDDEAAQKARIYKLAFLHVVCTNSDWAKEMKAIPGIGSKYSQAYHYSLYQGVAAGHSPGDWLLNHSDEMHAAMIEQYKKSHRNSNPPPAKTMVSLRTWWVENGGSA